MSDKEHIEFLTEKIAVLEQFVQACQLLTSAWHANDDFQGRLIDKLTARIESLEADNLGMGGVDGHRLEKLNDEKLANTVLRTDLFRIQAELRVLYMSSRQITRKKVDNVRAIALKALEKERASMSEGETDAHVLEKLTDASEDAIRLRVALMQIQTQSLALCKAWVGQSREDVDSIREIATSALDANPEEKTDGD